jgi:hypothetical protein
MTVLWNQKMSGFTMTGLQLKKGALFIGLSRKSVRPSIQKPLSRAWRRKEGDWVKTGIDGPGNAWFLGVARASAGKTMLPHSDLTVKNSLDVQESPFEAYRRARSQEAQR